jgi:hypothetical protein
MMGLADLHIHTTYSWDGTCTVAAVLKQAASYASLDVVAITDHNTIAGAVKAMELAPLYGVEMIPGSEISTHAGHVLALFIHEDVPAGRPLRETVLAVAEQGGLCVAAHPTAPGSSSLNGRQIREALRDPDVAKALVGVETYNAGVISRRSNENASVIAAQLGLAPVGSSDAHVVWAIGTGATEFQGRSAEDLRRALLSAATEAQERVTIRPSQVLGSWARRRLLRALGWVSSNAHPQAPIALTRQPI